VAELYEKIFKMKKIAGGLVVTLFIIIESQKAVDSLSSYQRCLVEGWR
jgi:hypothetical protein